MCIICAMAKHEDVDTACEFLSAFHRAQANMKISAELMKRCSEIAVRPATKKQYDRTHKKMVRLMKEWNKLEHFREAHQPHLEELAELPAPHKAIENFRPYVSNAPRNFGHD